MTHALALVLALSASAAAPKRAKAPACAPQKVAVKTPLTFPSGAVYTADVVDTPSTREKGLMCVRKLPKKYGMLFAFPMEMELGFWMKNTLVPLDIVWIGADKRVTAIATLPASRVDTPESEVGRAGGRGKYVLELAAGECKRLKLKLGDAVSFSVKTPEL